VGGVNSGTTGMWSRVKYPNGDQVMVSMAKDEAKLLRMKWGGLLPERELVTLDCLALVDVFDLWNGYTPLQRSQTILARVTEAISAYDSAAEVETAFNDPASPYPRKRR
jgi:hypothetical protein